MHFIPFKYLARKDTYSEEAFQTFLDNSRLGARLHSSGLYIDEPYRLRYQKECHKMMAWGITYTATARCMIKMKKHSKLMADIKKYNQIFKLKIFVLYTLQTTYEKLSLLEE